MANLDGVTVRTFEGRQRQLAGLAKARARSLESRSSSSPLIPINRVLRGPKRLRPKHLDIARRVVLGQTHETIARDTGLSAPIIHTICRTPLFLDEVKRLQGQVESHFVTQAALDPVRRFAQEQALPTLHRLVALRDEAEKEDVQFKASMGLLEVGGYRKAPEVEKATTPLAGDVAEAIRIGLREVTAYIEIKRRSSDGRVDVSPRQDDGR